LVTNVPVIEKIVANIVIMTNVSASTTMTSISVKPGLGRRRDSR
jgi:hypothetical protein